MLTQIDYRRAVNSDFPQILALQAQNLRWNLDAAQQQQGFLSGEYNAQDLAAINHGLGIFVARDGVRVLAYAMAVSAEFANGVPLMAHMAPVSRREISRSAGQRTAIPYIWPGVR